MNNDPQHTKQKTKEWATWTRLKNGANTGNQKPLFEDGQTIQWPKSTNGQTMIHKTLNRKLKIEQQEPPGVNFGVPEG